MTRGDERKKEGGLGVRNLRSHDKSLLFKWLWRYNDGSKRLWGQLIEAKYGRKDLWVPVLVNPLLWGEFGVPFVICGMNIISLLSLNWKTAIIFYSILMYGREMKDKKGKVADFYSTNGWQLTFRRDLSDWEINEYERLIQLLDNVKLEDYKRDSTIRVASIDGNSQLTDAILCYKSNRDAWGRYMESYLEVQSSR